MRSRAEQSKRRRAEQSEPIPEIRPWCEAGWTFYDGDARVIERLDRDAVRGQNDGDGDEEASPRGRGR